MIYYNTTRWFGAINSEQFASKLRFEYSMACPWHYCQHTLPLINVQYHKTPVQGSIKLFHKQCQFLFEVLILSKLINCLRDCLHRQEGQVTEVLE
jgi:hypothetical protein